METKKHGVFQRVLAFFAECWTLVRAFYTIAGSGDADHGPKPPQPVTVSDDDPDMRAAIAEAQSTLDIFISELQDPRGREFFVKAAFPNTSGTFEHLWISRVSWGEDAFHGTVSNVPKGVGGLALGVSVTVPKASVSDWMIKDGTTTLGGTTMRVLKERRSARERGPGSVKGGS